MGGGGRSWGAARELGGGGVLGAGLRGSVLRAGVEVGLPQRRRGARVRVREFCAGWGSWGVASRVGLRKKGPGAFTAAGMGPGTAGGGPWLGGGHLWALLGIRRGPASGRYSAGQMLG